MSDKKARMTDSERVKALLRREKPDRVPIWPFANAGFCCVYTGTSIADAYNKPEVSLAAQRKTAHDFGWIYAPAILYAAIGSWEFGGEIKWPSGEWDGAPSVSRKAVESVDDIWKLKVPEDVSKSGIIPLAEEVTRLAFNENLDNQPFKAQIFAGAAFTMAGNICGPDLLCKWLIKKPEAVLHLLRLVTDYAIELGKYWKEKFGTEDIITLAAGEATTDNRLISAKQFEEFGLPYNKETAESALAIGYKHIYAHLCGEQNENLPFWAQVPMGDPGIISIGHEIKLETAAKYFPNDIILGNLEPAIIQAMSPEEVYEAAKKNIQEGMALSTGYIFSPGCELPPMSPVENVMAMTRAVNDVGWYD